MVIASGRMRPIVLVTALVLIAIVAVVLHRRSGPVTTVAAQVTASAHLPLIETARSPVVASIHLTNRGKAIKHLVLDVSGCLVHWNLKEVVLGTGRDATPSSVNYYDVGPLSHGGTMRATMRMTSKDAGYHAWSLAVWGNVDKFGIPTGSPLQTLTIGVTINQ
jgi:hypothetical protein